MRNDRLKVTVLIPNYNHCPFLIERIDSVLNQTYDNFNVIILDDCSTDDSRIVIEKYEAHEKVSDIIYNKVNSGTTFKQWEKGISLATGEWIWIAESDDWCEPTLLENLINGVDDNCTVAFCQSIVVGSDKKILWASSSDVLEVIRDGKEFIESKMLLGSSIFNSSMAIFKKTAYENIEKDFTDFKFCGDWLFWIRILMQGDVFVSGKYLNYFRKHDKDVSGKAYKNGLFYSEHAKVIEIISKYENIIKLDKYNVFAKKLVEARYDNRLDPDVRADIIKLYYDLLKTNFGYDTYKIIGKKLYLNGLMYFFFNKAL